MSAQASITKTAIDYSAEGYWQDFVAKRPIAGGIAYESELHACQLDETLASLQRVDILLSQIRRDYAKAAISNALDESAILADDKPRNLLLFLAFYAGRVLARQWQSAPHWYGVFELRRRYTELTIDGDDFYQHIALVYKKDSPDSDDIFFALEPIGLRLFGNIDRPFKAVQGGQVANGLYQAVSARLPDATIHKKSKVENKASTDKIINTTVLKPSASIADTDIGTNTNNNGLATKDPAVEPASKTTSLDKDYETQDYQAATPIHKNMPADENLNNDTVSSVPSVDHSPKKELSPTPEIFTQLLVELNEIEVTQDVNSMTELNYKKACKILDQFERHIARQHKPRARVLFSASHQSARWQALELLQQAANEGHTGAMLRLAMYELLVEGLVAKDKDSDYGTKESLEKDSLEAGVAWVKQSADKEDNRAQRLLSKLYYQGIGVKQDLDMGKYWLEKAADNGHLEAAGVMTQWQQAQLLITSQQQEQHSIKRYQLLIGAVVLLSIVLILFI